MLLTFGFILILEEAVKAIWGLDYKELNAPAIFAAPTNLFGATVSTYRLFIIGFGAVAAAILFVALEKTRIGVVVRAASSDPEMVRGLGIDVGLVRTGVFAFGTGVPVTLKRYGDMNHGFISWVGLIDRSGEALDAGCAWLRRVLDPVGALP